MTAHEAIGEYDALAVSRIIKDWREEHRISQTKLAERINCDHSYISRVESRDRRPSREVILDIAEALGKRPHDLLSAAGMLAVEPNPYAMQMQRVGQTVRDLADMLGIGVTDQPSTLEHALIELRSLPYSTRRLATTELQRITSRREGVSMGSIMSWPDILICVTADDVMQAIGFAKERAS